MKKRTELICITKSVHGTLLVCVKSNLREELKSFFGVLDVWAYNPNGRSDTDGYVTYEVDTCLSDYFKSDSFSAMLTRFGINFDVVTLKL